MTAPALLRVTETDPDEWRAFLAAWGAASGWVTWSCVCGRVGEAPCRSSAWRAFRVHYVTAHVPPGVQAQQVSVSAANAVLDTAE